MIKQNLTEYQKEWLKLKKEQKEYVEKYNKLKYKSSKVDKKSMKYKHYLKIMEYELKLDDLRNRR